MVLTMSHVSKVRRFRKVAQRQEAPSVIPIEAECCERVMIDIEGPSTPADLDGCIYVMTYICTVIMSWSSFREDAEVQRYGSSTSVCLLYVQSRYITANVVDRSRSGVHEPSYGRVYSFSEHW